MIVGRTTGGNRSEPIEEWKGEIACMKAFPSVIADWDAGSWQMYPKLDEGFLHRQGCLAKDTLWFTVYATSNRVLDMAVKMTYSTSGVLAPSGHLQPAAVEGTTGGEAEMGEGRRADGR